MLTICFAVANLVTFDDA